MRPGRRVRENRDRPALLGSQENLAQRLLDALQYYLLAAESTDAAPLQGEFRARHLLKSPVAEVSPKFKAAARRLDCQAPRGRHPVP